MVLHNKIDKKVLRERLATDTTARKTLSFYKYVHIENPNEFRDFLYKTWDEMGCLGRIYVANEGINAQMSVPEESWNAFEAFLQNNDQLKNTPLKIAVEDDGKSFYKLKIKVRPKVLADGLDDSTFNPWNTGNHLNAKQFNEALENGAIVVDMRNHYESEVGHFVGAIKPDCDTFRDELAMVEEILEGKEDQKILMYCTGGIRCEKASAYFKHKGFKDVNQLQGGIIEYAHQIKEEGLESKYIGKNFVFDERLGERITEDIIAHCHQCGEPCDDHTNCQNLDCHLLFIQCPSCKEKYENCCSDECVEIARLPIEEQREKRKGQNKGNALNVFKKGRIGEKIKPIREHNSVLKHC
jgi:UPF0176 protein